MKSTTAIKSMAIAGALAMSIALVGCGGQSKPAETKTEEKTTQTQQQPTQNTQDTSKTSDQNTSQNSGQNTSNQTQTQNQNQAPAQTQTQTQAPAQTTAPAAQQISADEAKSIALADAGVTAADVRDLKAELDTDDAVVHYDVDFKVGNTEHDYDIDAHTGAIIHHKTEVDD